MSIQTGIFKHRLSKRNRVLGYGIPLSQNSSEEEMHIIKYYFTEYDSFVDDLIEPQSS